MTEKRMNGFSHRGPDTIEDAITEIKQLAATTAARKDSAHVQQIEPPSSQPFEQQDHDLLLQSIDQVATDWVYQLRLVRENCERVEQLVMQRTIAVKAQITGLYLLGNAARAEAQRGDEVTTKLANEIDKLIEQPA